MPLRTCDITRRPIPFFEFKDCLGHLNLLTCPHPQSLVSRAFARREPICPPLRSIESFSDLLRVNSSPVPSTHYANYPVFPVRPLTYSPHRTSRSNTEIVPLSLDFYTLHEKLVAAPYQRNCIFPKHPWDFCNTLFYNRQRRCLTACM